MSVENGFNDLQGKADAELNVVLKARERRDMFKVALEDLPDIVKVKRTGSLARGTHCDPIHDVDLVAVYVDGSHDGWGDDGPSAEEALEYTRSRITELVGPESGQEDFVRLTRLQNHSVKCFLDDPEDPDTFTVDVTPGLVHPERGLWIPERMSEKWVRSDPDCMIKLTGARHAEWNQFAKLVRVLKRWNIEHGKPMKSLVVEVLALQHLPVDDRPRALASFLQSASVAIDDPVCDPAGLCGEIDPKMDREAARAQLDKAADLAWRAVDLDANGKGAQAMCTWRKLFGGDLFPEPPGGCNSGAGAGAGAAAAAQVRRPIADMDQG